MIHVCYGLYDKDGHYSKFVGTSIVSILENTKEKVTIHIIHDNTLTADNRSKFNYISKLYKRPIKFYNAETLAADELADIKNNLPPDFTFHYTIAASYRLLIPRIININKVIYLDADIIINRNIKDLWTVDLNGCPLAAVNELAISSSASSGNPMITSNLVHKEDYFNSGVLLINVELLRKNYNIILEGEKFVTQNIKSPFWDQNLLNYCFADNYIKLSADFNRFILVDRILGRTETLRRAFYHFCSKSLELNINDIFNRLYFTYFVKTPWFNLEMLNNIFNAVRNFTDERNNFMLHLSKLLARRQRAFFTGYRNFEALKQIVSVTENEEFINVKKPFNDKIANNLIKSMRESVGTKVFFLFVEDFYSRFRDILIQNNFIENTDFINGEILLSYKQGVPFETNFIVREM